jgi:hypothetical protein
MSEVVHIRGNVGKLPEYDFHHDWNRGTPDASENPKSSDLRLNLSTQKKGHPSYVRGT